MGTLANFLSLHLGTKSGSALFGGIAKYEAEVISRDLFRVSLRFRDPLATSPWTFVSLLTMPYILGAQTLHLTRPRLIAILIHLQPEAPRIHFRLTSRYNRNAYYTRIVKVSNLPFPDPSAGFRHYSLHDI